MSKNPATLVLCMVIGFASAARADQGPFLDRNFQIPTEYRATQASSTDHTLEDAPVTRYRNAYEAFWWNCVAIKADDVDNRCPFFASGWPAEMAGASDGALKASNDIQDLLKKYGRAKVQAYLHNLATPNIVKAKIRGWFTKPTADPHGF